MLVTAALRFLFVHHGHRTLGKTTVKGHTFLQVQMDPSLRLGSQTLIDYTDYTDNFFIVLAHVGGLTAALYCKRETQKQRLCVSSKSLDVGGPKESHTKIQE